MDFGVPMTGRSVFVVWQHPLFFEAVRLLLNESSVSLVGATSDPVQARSQIEQLNPNVVILEHADDQPLEEEDRETMAILNAGPHVIRLSLADNELNVYRRERRTIGKIEDLVNLLKNDIDLKGTVD
jgi:DNA-binding NarL/FixJ family response regulator